MGYSETERQRKRQVDKETEREREAETGREIKRERERQKIKKGGEITRKER